MTAITRGAAVALLAVTAALAGACGSGTGTQAGPTPEPGALPVVATTTVLADLVRSVGGSKVNVSSLVPAGGEVHTFDPRPSDVTAVADAELIVMNGLGLDEWAAGLVEGSGSSATVVELGEELDGVDYLDAGSAAEPQAEPGDHDHEGVNPHLWLNVGYARLYVARIGEALAEADPADAATYVAQAAAYDTELATLDATIRGRMAGLPAESRRIVSFHEAFPYFAAAYGLEIVGVVVEAPGQDPSAGDIAELVAAIRSSGARAVFSEAQFDDRLVRTIADEAGVTVESELYNDSLGPPPADSYLGMMRLNLERIEAALR